MNAGLQIFRATRAGKYYESWAAYLRDRDDTEHARSLDGAIRSTNREDRHLSDDPLDPDVLPGKKVLMRDLAVRARVTPWPTFVLGTGCLSASASTRDNGRAVVSKLTAAVESVAGRQGFAKLVMRFLDNLSRNRCDQPLASAGLGLATGARRSKAEWEFIAQAGLAAMLLTQLYGEALIYSNQVVSDPHREEVAVPPETDEEWQLHDTLVLPLLEELDRLADAVDRLPGEAATERSARASLRSLARTIAVSIRDDRRVSRPHTELLTAFTWFFLTENTYLYPDWSDLLLFGAFVDLDEGAPPPAWDNSQLKPRMPVSETSPFSGWLRSRLLTITTDSWQSRANRGTASPRTELYDAVAAILWQQAENFHGIRQPGSGSARHITPIPSCFVTTLDLELEMAMWARAVESGTRQPFIVVLPYFRTLRTTSVTLGWVWREIVPDPDLDPVEVLTAEDPTVWRYLEQDPPPTLSNKPEHQGRTPVIVRLAGSPLMKVAMDGVDGIQQALLLDEYTALRQTVLDLSAAARANVDGDAPIGTGEQKVVTPGLPAALMRSVLSTRNAYMPRYWMFLGAQLSDTGVRLRLLANQITGAAQNSGQGAVPLGVAINRRSRPADRDVFHWYGLDVVSDDVLHSQTQSLSAELRDLHTRLGRDFAEIAQELAAARAEGKIW